MVLRFIFLTTLLLGMTTISACTHDILGAQGQDAQDVSELSSGYHPSVRYGTLVSIDSDGYGLTLNIQRELNQDSDGEMLNDRIIRFVWDKPIDEYWSWFIENAKVGDTIKVSFHMPKDTTAETDNVPVMSIVLDGYADVCNEYSRSAAQQEWERLREQNME
jgi:hypothetical protein